MMLDATILPRLIDTAVSLRHSVRHQESGIAALYPAKPHSSLSAAVVTQDVLLTITFIPESQQPGMTNINDSASPVRVRPETELETSIRALLTGAMDFSASKGDGHDPRPRLQSITISVPQQVHPALPRSLGELFWGEGNAVLLENVLSFLPTDEVLNVTQVCSNVDQVVSGSPRLQQRLGKFYRATVPGYPIGFEKATSTQMIRWIQEYVLRHEQLRPHCSSMEYERSEGFEFVESDGGMELYKRYTFSTPSDERPYGTAKFIIHDTNPPDQGRVELSPRCQSPRSSACIYGYEHDEGWDLAKISAQDDLLVLAKRLRKEWTSTEGKRCDVWRLQFCRLTSTPDATNAIRGSTYHPAARLPVIQVAFDRNAEIECPALVTGPDGLLAFEANTLRESSPAIILDWKRGEARGVLTTFGHREPATRFTQLKQHGFASESILLSAGGGNIDHLGADSGDDVDDELDGLACIWLSFVPLQGQGPRQMPARQLDEDDRGVQDVSMFECAHMPKIYPEAIFWLPLNNNHRQRHKPTWEGAPPFTMLHTGIQVTPASTFGDFDAGFALLSLVGTTDQDGHRSDYSTDHPVQCSTVVRISGLYALWKTARLRSLTEHPTAHDYSRRRPPIHHFSWDDWREYAHTCLLNSYTTPVLHGSRLILGFSAETEGNGPRVTWTYEGPYEGAIEYPSLQLAIRDFAVSPTAPRNAPIMRHLSACRRDRQPESKAWFCTSDPMILRSRQTVIKPAPQHTRDMFAPWTIEGELPYEEVIGTLPPRLIPEQDDYLMRGLSYDGANLVLLVREGVRKQRAAS